MLTIDWIERRNDATPAARGAAQVVAMFSFSSMAFIEELFSNMEPELQRGEAFTPSLHAQEFLLEDVPPEGEDEDEVAAFSTAALDPFTGFVGSGVPSALTAIDAGVIDLGITRTGFALAFKAAVVHQAIDGIHTVTRVGPRVKLITPENRAGLLRFVGDQLGNETMFVTLVDGLPIVKAGATEPNQFKDRIRNIIERMLQLDVAKQLQGGLLLIDGALTLRTYNTPQEFLELLAREVSKRNSDIVGVSKKSRVTVDGVHMGALLDDAPPDAGYRRIVRVDATGSEADPEARNLGVPFAVRFAPGGFTFRVDVTRQSPLASEEEVLEALYTNTQMTLGYPNLLRLAHIHSAFTKSEIVSLQVQSAHDYGMSMRMPEDLSVIFAPFRKGIGG